ncbi:MAG: Imm53 family immunity protein [Fimbriimonadaceae bacterium]
MSEPVAPVQTYWHAHASATQPLDLCVRLAKWFINQCDYDWEHGEGITLLADPEIGWTFSVETSDNKPLREDDLRILGRGVVDGQIEFLKEGSIFISKCPSQNVIFMLSRVLEWLEEDWKQFE